MQLHASRQGSGAYAESLILILIYQLSLPYMPTILCSLHWKTRKALNDPPGFGGGSIGQSHLLIIALELG